MEFTSALEFTFAIKQNSWGGFIIDIYRAKKGIIDVSNEATVFFDKYKKNGKNLSQIILNVSSHKSGLDSFIKDSELADESLIAFLKDTKYGTKDLANYQQYLKDTGGATSTFATFTKKAGSVLKSFGAALASMGINMIIGMGLDGAITLIDNYANSAEHAKEAAENFDSSIKSQQEEFTSNTARVDELSSEYERLSKGVSDLGENVNLSSEEYDSYKKIVSELSAIMPNLTAIFNNHGEKIGFVKGKLEDANKEYEKYKQNQAKKILNEGDETGKKLSDIVDDYNNQNDTGFISDQLNGVKSFFTGNGYDDLFSNRELLEALEKLRNMSQDEVASQLGMANSLPEHITKILSAGISDGGSASDLQRALQDILGYDASKILDMDDTAFATFQEELEAKIDHYSGLIDTSSSRVTDSLLTIAQSKQEYWDLGDDTQYVTTLLSMMNDDMLKAVGVLDESGNISENSMRSFINNIIKIIRDNKNNVNDAFKDLLTMDKDSMSQNEIVEKMGSCIDTICDAFGFDEKGKKQFKITLGLDVIKKH